MNTWILILGFFGLILGIIIYDTQNTNRLMEQCMQDGHKEYECVGILRNSNTQIIPVIQ